MEIEETVSVLDNCYHQLMQFNPQLQIIFTVSPVRHLRDGVVANNRSKARLIESVHHLTEKFNRLHYFPAYDDRDVKVCCRKQHPHCWLRC